MNDFIEAQREFNREALGFAHGYLQGLVVVGYAGIFFLWDKAEDRLPPGLWAAVGLLLCISVGIYLAWEVFAFLIRQRILIRQASVLGKPGDPPVDQAEFHAGIQRSLHELRNLIPKLRAIWHPAMFGIIAPVALAWAVVLVAFAADFVRVLARGG